MLRCEKRGIFLAPPRFRRHCPAKATDRVALGEHMTLDGAQKPTHFRYLIAVMLFITVVINYLDRNNGDIDKLIGRINVLLADMEARKKDARGSAYKG